MLANLIRLVGPPHGPATRLVSAMLRRGEATGGELLAGLAAAGRPLSAGRLRDLMGNLMDSGLVRVRAARGPAAPGRRGRPRRYASTAALRSPPRDGE